MKKNKVIVFDCDGTILNTFPLIMESFKQTFNKTLPNYKISEEELKSFFGPTLKESFSKYFKPEEITTVIDIYRTISKDLMPSWIKIYPGILNLLKYLKDKQYDIAILSNKAHDMIVYGLDLVGITKYFDLIIGYEQMDYPKPNPFGMEVIKKYFKSKCIYMVGDTPIDILTGKASNVTTVGVTWCITKKEDFIKANADFIIDDPAELIKILEA